MIRRTPHLVALAVLAMLAAGLAGAQEEKSEAAEPTSPPITAPQTAPVPLDPATKPLDEPTLNEIGRRAEETAGQLRHMTDALGDADSFAKIDSAVSAGTHQVGSRWAETGRLLDASPRRTALDSQRSAWQSLRTDLEDLQKTVDARDHAREADQKALAGLRESWGQTRDLARRSNAPEPVVTRVEQMLAAIDATGAQVDARRAHTLVWADAVSRAIQGCDDAVARIDDAEHDAAARTFVQHLPPVWKSRDLLADPHSGQGRLVHMNESARAGSESVRTYVAANRVGFVVTALLAAILMVAMRRARAGVELRSKSDAALAAALPIFQSPHAAALVLALMLTIPLRPDPPISVRAILLLLTIPALIALLRPLLDRRVRSSLYALVVLFIIELARRVVELPPGLEQLVMMLEMATAAVVLTRAAGRLREHGTTCVFYAAWFGRAASSALRLLGIATAIGAVAAMLGYVELADFAGGGSIFLAYVVFVALGVRAAFDGLLALALGAGPTSRLRAPRRHRVLIERRVRSVLDVGVALLWLKQAFDRFELLAPAQKIRREDLRCSAPLRRSRRVARPRDRLPGRADRRLLPGARHRVRSRRGRVLAHGTAPRRPLRVVEPDALRIAPAGILPRARIAGLRPDAPNGAGERLRARHRLRPAAGREQLRVGPDPALRTTDPGGRRRAARRHARRGDAHRHPLQHGAHARGRRGDRSQLEHARGEGHQLDALGSQAAHRSRRRRRLRHRRRNGDRAAAGSRRRESRRWCPRQPPPRSSSPSATRR